MAIFRSTNLTLRNNFTKEQSDLKFTYLCRLGQIKVIVNVNLAGCQPPED